MNQYHGADITPALVAAKFFPGRNAFISYAYLDNLQLVMEVCRSWALDNGAFSFWRSGKKPDWDGYQDFVAFAKKVPNCDFAIIPDRIDGNEADNDALMRDWQHGTFGVPVWHLHESLDRLERLLEWPRIALGSSGDYAVVGNTKWWQRMAAALEIICDKDGYPQTKIHGLRMMNPALYGVPFASVDSTNIARNIKIDSAWRGTYAPAARDVRAEVLASRMEAHRGATRWNKENNLTIQERLFA